MQLTRELQSHVELTEVASIPMTTMVSMLENPLLRGISKGTSFTPSLAGRVHHRHPEPAKRGEGSQNAKSTACGFVLQF